MSGMLLRKVEPPSGRSCVLVRDPLVSLRRQVLDVHLHAPEICNRDRQIVVHDLLLIAPPLTVVGKLSGRCRTHSDASECRAPETIE